MALAAQFAANVLPIIREMQAAGRTSLNRRAAQCPEARMARLDRRRRRPFRRLKTL